MNIFDIGSKVHIRTDLDKNTVREEIRESTGKEVIIESIKNGRYYLKGYSTTFNISMFSEFKDILDKHQKWLSGIDGGVRAILRGADLRGADLQGAYLRDAILRGADLQSADLRDAILRGADLQSAILRGADLRWAILQGADLRWADLRGADLQGADLQGADLRGADLQGAYLRGAKINDPIGTSVSIKKTLQVGPIGSRDDYTIIFVLFGDKLLVKCGCFYGDIDSFRKAVVKTHKGTKYEKQYMALIELALASVD